MTLTAGSRLGPYEVMSALGAGGMGEVYRARDSRLGREVAIKVLPQALASDPERLKRFEKEARSASALNHPNIVTVYDIGSQDGVSYLAMELVSGETLRALVSAGPMPIKKLLAIAPQIAEGLAKAHEAGIVHRDLKPENVMVTKDGLVKILDFGLAKLTSTMSGSDEGSNLPTMTGTTPGVVVGTVGYMSPEQASGQALDFRSDQFAFGSILYEMATGKRAFQKKTAIDTLASILNEEPQAVASINPQAPAPVRWIIERCLAKDPQERYVSTRDLARDLGTVQGHLSEAFSGPIVAEVERRRATRWIPWAVAITAAAALVVSISLSRRQAPRPHFQNVTFQQGAIWRARFAPDGQTIVYSMISAGDDLKPAELFSTRAGSLDPRSLGLPPADIFSISKSGQMAINLVKNPMAQEAGTLAEASLTGGAPRPILEDVWGADWSPDGKEMAVIHMVDGKARVEYPIGKTLYEATDFLYGPRVSPNGQLVAFTNWREGGKLLVVDRKGTVRTVIDVVDVPGPPCWSAAGDEIWWSKAPNVARVQSTEIHATSLKGQDRVMATLPGSFALHDLAADGRMLLENVSLTFTMLGTFPGEAKERNLGWLDQSFPTDLSKDAKLLVFGDRGDPGSATQGAYYRQTDGSPAVRLGEGSAGEFSPDGKWVLVCRKLPKHYLVLIPVGAGQEKVMPRFAPVPNGMVVFHPDGKRVIYMAAEPGGPERVYEQNIDGGEPKALTGDHVNLVGVSPDGKWFMTRAEGAKDVTLVPFDKGDEATPRTVTLQSTVEKPIHWSSDSRSLLVLVDGNNTRPFRVDRLDLDTGRRELWRTFTPPGRLGAGGMTNLALTADETAWAVGYQSYFSELLIADGLK